MRPVVIRAVGCGGVPGPVHWAVPHAHRVERAAYLAWCADRKLDPLAAGRAQIELYVQWMQEARRLKRSNPSDKSTLDWHRSPVPELPRFIWHATASAEPGVVSAAEDVCLITLGANAPEAGSAPYAWTRLYRCILR